MKNVLALGFILYLLGSCSSIKKTAAVKDDGKIEVNFLLINDVYEIAPLSEGREGGYTWSRCWSRERKTKGLEDS